LLSTSSLLLGFAILLKPIAIIIAVFVPIPLLLVTHLKTYTKLSLAALVLLIPVLTVIGWTARNRAVAGISTFSSISVKNLFAYRAAGVLALVNHKTIEEERRILRAQVAFPAGFSMLSEGPVLIQSPEALERAQGIARAVLLQHPAALVRMTIRDFLYLAWTPGLRDIEFWLSGGGAHGASGEDATVSEKLGQLATSSAPVVAMSLLQEIVLLLIWIGSGISLAYALRYRDWQMLWFLAIALMLLFAAAGPEGGARLRMPTIPILAIVAAAGFAMYSNQKSPIAQAGHAEKPTSSR